MIAIEKGIARPPDRGGRPAKYPFAQMKDGDSFAVSVPPGRTARTVTISLASCASGWARRNKSPLSFSVRVVEENGEQQIRCWAYMKPTT